MRMGNSRTKRRVKPKPRPNRQKVSIHRGSQPSHGRALIPKQALVTQAIRKFQGLHPRARVQAMTSEFVGAYAFVWIFYTE